MGIDLTQIAQQLTNTIQNGANVVKRLFDLHYNPTPLDIELLWIDENGNTITVKQPNRSKIKADFDSWKETARSADYLIGENLIKDSYVTEITDVTDDDGNHLYYRPNNYYSSGVLLEAVHPYTKGFEGPYVSSKPDTAVDDPELATKDNPYWYGVYNKGPRLSRGGLADGWSGIASGNILKITASASDTASNRLIGFVPTKLITANQIRFRCYLKIAKGSRVGFGVDSGINGVASGYVITKETTDTAYQGWYKVDIIVNTSKVTEAIGTTNFIMGFDYTEDIEVYLALPSAHIVPGAGYNLQLTQEV